MLSHPIAMVQWMCKWMNMLVTQNGISHSFRNGTRSQVIPFEQEFIAMHFLSFNTLFFYISQLYAEVTRDDFRLLQMLNP